MRIQQILALGLFALVAFMSGCASVTKQATNIYPEPKPDKGLVYFFRESRFEGSAVSYNIKENEQVIGAVADGTYFFVFCEPGYHTYTASTEADSSRVIFVKAGGTYFINCGIKGGMVAARPSLHIASEAEARSILPDLTYAIK
jgi:hypothetical protein